MSSSVVGRRQSSRSAAANSQVVSGDWLYDDALLHPLHDVSLMTQSPVVAPQMAHTHDGNLRRLPRPGKRGRGAELLDASYLRQIIPTRNRSALLSTTHRRKRALRGNKKKRGRGGKRAGSALSATSDGDPFASGTPSWLEHLPARSSTVPHKTMRERWRAMTQKREPQDDTLDAETRAQMAQEKQELATSMGLTMAELEEMDQAAGGDEDAEAEYKRAFEVRLVVLHVMLPCRAAAICRVVSRCCQRRCIVADVGLTRLSWVLVYTRMSVVWFACVLACVFACLLACLLAGGTWCRSLTRMARGTFRRRRCAWSSKTWAWDWTRTRWTK